MNKKVQGRIGAFLIIAFDVLGGTGCGGGNHTKQTSGFEPGLSITPATYTMATGRSQNIHANLLEYVPDTLSWKVVEGDAGGTIKIVHEPQVYFDETIIYTAPSTPGTYHIELTGTYTDNGTYRGGTKTHTTAIEVK